jgi:hypothetical protein
MRQKRNIRSSPPPTAKPVRLELLPDRACVLHLDVRAQLPRRVVGRVEHVTSGQVAHVTSLGELMAFMAKVLRNQVRGGRETAYATEERPCTERHRLDRRFDEKVRKGGPMSAGRDPRGNGEEG